MDLDELARKAGLLLDARYDAFYTENCEGVKLDHLRALVNEVLEEAAEMCRREHLNDPTDSADDLAYDMAVNDCISAIRSLKLK